MEKRSSRQEAHLYDTLLIHTDGSFTTGLAPNEGNGNKMITLLRLDNDTLQHLLVRYP